MKKLLVALSILTAAHTAQATVLDCSPFLLEDNYQIGIEGSYDYECSTLGSYSRYIVKIRSTGLGLHTEGPSALLITCPSIPESALAKESFINRNGKKKKGVKSFKGGRAQAALGLGADAGVIVSNRGDVCTMTGIGMSFGVNLTGFKMTIGTEYHH